MESKHMYAHHSSSSVSNVFPIGTYEGLSYKVLAALTENRRAHLTMSDQQGNTAQQEIFVREMDHSCSPQKTAPYFDSVQVQDLKNQSTSSDLLLRFYIVNIISILEYEWTRVEHVPIPIHTDINLAEIAIRLGSIYEREAGRIPC